jgi:hypothetical protein
MSNAVSQRTECPVAALALRVGTLWLADAQAQKNEFGKDRDELSDSISEPINELRIATEQMASFERARSLAGALFQLALVHETANRLYEEFTGEDHLVNSTFRKLNRLLESAAMVLRDEMGASYEPFQEVISTYINLDESSKHRILRSIEKIPEMADEYRRSEKVTA